MELYAAVLFCFVSGVFGYIVVRFWVIPIWRYARLKRRLTANLQFFLGPRHDSGENVHSESPLAETATAIRHNSAALSSCFTDDLPYWYKLLLSRRNESPMDAAKHLIILSNIRNPEHAKQRAEEARRALRIADEN